MNIFRYIKSKFIKDKCIGILNISSLINIPGRLYFKDDLNSIKEIDEYKSIYYKLLNNRTKLLTRDIKIDSLQEDIIMNVELLIKNSLNTNYLELDKLELKVYHLKLYLYLNELDILKKRLIIRLISLKELQDEKIIPHINRETLSIEINNLSITLLTILNQLSAINIERNNILDNISLNNKLDNEELLKLRYDETRELYKYIKGKKLNDNILMELSYMDRYLEIYAYKTKDKMSILNRKLDIISKEKNLSNRANLLKKISEIEIYYVIFEQYGKNIITDDDLYKLYRIKFDILTLDVNYKFQDSYFNEYRYYYSIIEEKLNNLLRGNNDNIKVVFKEDYIKALFKIKELLKNSNNEYDVHDILVTDYKLQTLLSFDSANGYKDLLYNYKIELLFSYEGENVNPGFNISLYNKPNNIFNYHSRNLYVSLKDLLELEYAKYYYYKTKNNDIHSINYESIFLKLKYYLFIQCNIYILYKINNENHNNIYYKIPEGIINLLTKDTYVRDKYDRDDIYDYFSGIKKLCNKKIIVMPSTLKKIDNYFFKNTGALGVVLNENLKEIEQHLPFNTYQEYGLNITDVDRITYVKIPASLENITISTRDRIIKTIEFSNFKDSKILNDRDKLFHIFSQLLYVEFIPKNDVYLKDTVELKTTLDKIILDNYIIDCKSLIIKEIVNYNKLYSYNKKNYEKYKCISKYSTDYGIDIKRTKYLYNSLYGNINYRKYVMDYYKENFKELVNLFINNLYSKIEELTGYKLKGNRKGKKLTKN